MDAGDLRTVILVAGLLLGWLLRLPQLSVAAAIGVAFWHGYEIGQKYGLPEGYTTRTISGPLSCSPSCAGFYCSFGS